MHAQNPFRGASYLQKALNEWPRLDLCSADVAPVAGRYLAPKEIDNFLVAASVDQDRIPALVLVFELMTGLTADELLSSTWSIEENPEILNWDVSVHFIDAEGEEKAWYRDYDDILLNNAHVVSGLLRFMFPSNDGDGSLVFVRDGKPLTRLQVDAALARIAKCAKIQGLTHDDLLCSHGYIAVTSRLHSRNVVNFPIAHYRNMRPTSG